MLSGADSFRRTLAVVILEVGFLVTCASAADDDSIVALPEFQVTGQDSGYESSLSTVASRVAEKTSNLPYQVDVITADFLRDSDAQDYNDALAFTSSFGGNNSAVLGGYTLRGIPTRTLYDGFDGGGLVDFDDISRVEVIKGPAAAIYGQTAPGGLINLMPIMPSSQPQQSVRANVGSYDLARWEVSSTGPIGPAADGTAYRIYGSDQQRDFESAFTERRTRDASIGISQQLSPQTTLFVRFDYVDRLDHGVDSPILFLANPSNTALRTGFAYQLFDFNQTGPEAYFTRSQYQGIFTADHRFSRIFSFRLAGFFYDRINHNFQESADRYDPATQQVILRTPQYISQRVDGRSLEAELAAAWRWQDIAWRTLFTWDYDYSHSLVHAFQLPAAENTNAVDNVRNLSVSDPNWFMLPYSPVNYPVISSDRLQNTAVNGLFLRQQASLFQDRLLLLAGAREDFVIEDYDDRVADLTQHGSPHDLTTQFGANFKLTPNVILYASRAESFLPQTGGNGQLFSVDEVGHPLPNETGLGYEAGVKIDEWEHRLSFTTAAYRIERNNVLDTDLVDLPNGSTELLTRTTAQYVSEGVEADIDWRITPHWQLIGGGGLADPRITKDGNDLDEVGRPEPRSPRQQGGLAGHFTGSGVLKGFSARIGVTYTGKTYPYSTQSTTAPSGSDVIAVGQGDSRRDFSIPCYQVWQAGVSYDFGAGKLAGRSFRQRVQLNVKNLFDKKYLDDAAYAADRRNLTASYELSY